MPANNSRKRKRSYRSMSSESSSSYRSNKRFRSSRPSSKSKIIGKSNTTSKPRRKRTIPKAVRDKVWNHYIGIEKGVAKCICCQNQQISQNNFECGHVVAESKGGRETVTNLRPVCGLCNKSMGATNMISFMREHGYVIDRTFHGRFEELRKMFPHGYYYCSGCGHIQAPSNSWFSWFWLKCQKCKGSVSFYSTAYLWFF